MNSQHKTLVLGASPNPERYSYKAVMALVKNGYEVAAIGKRKGYIGSVQITDGSEAPQNIHTITIYMNSMNQEKWFDFILNCHPKRIILNPGAENELLKKTAMAKGIEVIDGCTLVMLATGTY